MDWNKYENDLSKVAGRLVQDLRKAVQERDEALRHFPELSVQQYHHLADRYAERVNQTEADIAVRYHLRNCRDTVSLLNRLIRCAKAAAFGRDILPDRDKGQSDTEYYISYFARTDAGARNPLMPEDELETDRWRATFPIALYDQHDRWGFLIDVTVDWLGPVAPSEKCFPHPESIFHGFDEAFFNARRTAQRVAGGFPFSYHLELRTSGLDKILIDDKQREFFQRSFPLLRLVGPSAGAAIASALNLMRNGYPIASDVLVSGTIDTEGCIGQVDGWEWKIKAARESGKIRAIVYAPEIYDPGKIEIRLVPVERIEEASNEMRGDQPGPPLGNSIPPIPEHFQPDEAVFSSAKDALLRRGEKPARVGVAGTGGVGKSTLAAALAREDSIRRRYSDGILWLGLTTETTADSVALDFLSALSNALSEADRITANQTDSWSRATHLLRFWSNQNKKKSGARPLALMVVIDNVWPANQNCLAEFTRLVAEFHDCSILFTTRNHELLADRGVSAYTIETLTQEASRALVASIVGSTQGELPPIALQAIDQCGGLPIALEIIAMAHRSDQSWEAISDALKKAELEVLNHGDKYVTRTIEASLDLLKKDNSEHYGRFIEMAVLPDAPAVADSGIMTLWARTGKIDALGSDTLLVKLKNLSLLKLEGKNPREIKLHDLMRDYLKWKYLKDHGGEGFRGLHAKMVEAYREKCEENEWHRGPNDGYHFQNLAWHFFCSGGLGDLRSLLCDYRWMQAVITHLSPQSLIDNYEHLLITKQQIDSSIVLIRDALRLSANALSANPNELAFQLIGRLQHFGEETIQRIVSDAYRTVVGGFEVVRTTLTQPGAHIRNLLSYHGRGVSKLWISHDGGIAYAGFEDGNLIRWDFRGDEVRSMPLQGHVSEITQLWVSCNGSMVVSGALDGNLIRWDVQGDHIRHTLLRGHTEGRNITRLWVSCDGSVVVSGGIDGKLIRWCFDGDSVRQLPMNGHTVGIKLLGASDDGDVVFSLDLDNRLFRWTFSGEEIRSTPLTGHDPWTSELWVSRDGSIALVGGRHSNLVRWRFVRDEAHITRLPSCGEGVGISQLRGSDEGDIIISGDQKGNLIRLDFVGDNVRCTRLFGHTQFQWISHIWVSGDGSLALSGGTDGKLIRWSFNNENLRRDITPDRTGLDGRSLFRVGLSGEVAKPTPLKGFQGRITQLWVNDDGTMALSGYSDGSLVFWNMKEDIVHSSPLAGHSNSISQLRVSGDGRVALTADDDGKLIHWRLDVDGVFSGDRATKLPMGRRHVQLWVSEDGRVALSVGTDGNLIRWNFNQDDVNPVPLTSHGLGISVLWVSSDGATVIAGAWKTGELIHWSFDGGDVVLTLMTGHTTAVRRLWVSDDGSVALSWDGNGRLIRWIFEGNAVRSKALTSGLPPNRTYGVEVSADGSMALVHHVTGVNLWRIDECNVRITNLPLYWEVGSIHPSYLWMSRNGRIALSAHDDGKLVRWNFSEDKVHFAFLDGHIGSISQLWVSSDDGVAISGDENGNLLVWRFNGDEVRSTPLIGHTSRITQVWASSDAGVVLSGDSTGLLIRWNLDHSAVRSVSLIGHRTEISRISVSGDRQTALSGDIAGRLLIWSLTDEFFDKQIHFDHGVSNIVVSRNGRRLLIMDNAGNLHVLNRGA